jgi:multicomponent Na+:H+ antiporter subunit B
MKYIVIVSLILILLMIIPETMNVKLPETNVQEIAKYNNIPNTVTAIYLRERLFDTIFEVVVFSIAVFGINFFHTSDTRPSFYIEKSFSRVTTFSGFIMFIASVYLAVFGHLSPGGGFSAGVAGGTSVLLMSLGEDPQKLKEQYKRINPEIQEKISILLIVAASIVEFAFELPPSKNFGSLFSGGMIPIQSILIFIKVAAGTWVLTHNLTEHRGTL